MDEVTGNACSLQKWSVRLHDTDDQRMGGCGCDSPDCRLHQTAILGSILIPQGAGNWLKGKCPQVAGVANQEARSLSAIVAFGPQQPHSVLVAFENPLRNSQKTKNEAGHMR